MVTELIHSVTKERVDSLRLSPIEWDDMNSFFTYSEIEKTRRVNSKYDKTLKKAGIDVWSDANITDEEVAMCDLIEDRVWNQELQKLTRSGVLCVVFYRFVFYHKLWFQSTSISAFYPYQSHNYAFYRSFDEKIDIVCYGGTGDHVRRRGEHPWWKNEDAFKYYYLGGRADRATQQQSAPSAAPSVLKKVARGVACSTCGAAVQSGQQYCETCGVRLG